MTKLLEITNDRKYNNTHAFIGSQFSYVQAQYWRGQNNQHKTQTSAASNSILMSLKDSFL